MRFIAAFFLLSTVAQTPTWAIVLLDAATNRQIAGHVVSEDADRITVKVAASGKDETFDRAKIKIVHQVDRKLLESLTKDNPKGYRDYAEKLAEQKADPEARDTALRLFLIAAYLDPSLGRNSLLSMSRIAASPDDGRKYRALAFLLDPKGDITLLKEDAVKPVVPTGGSKPSDNDLKFFLLALQKFRQGDFKNALTYAEVKGVDAYFKAAPGKLDYKSFVRAIRDNSKDESLLEKVLAAEIWGLEQTPGAPPQPPTKNASASWSSAVNDSGSRGAPILRLEVISEFDPRKCVYRNGTWELP